MGTLYKALNVYTNRQPIRFHMPGHKGKDILGLGNLLSLDLTELDGLDNLHFPNGIIEKASKDIARCFRADYSYMLVNGSSAGIIGAILTVCSKNSKIVCARNSHVSLYKGLYLTGAVPIFVMPEIIEKYGICGGVNIGPLEKVLKKHNPTAIFVVSPTYEGITSNIEAIAALSHKYGCVLIVDEAHGSHFKFNSIFPKTALEQGADIVIQSHHKTLAALGQGAVLHVKGKRVDIEKLNYNLSVLQTTSPSYIIMASLDRNREFLETTGKNIFAQYVSNLVMLRAELEKAKCMTLIGDEILKGENSLGLDLGKITLYTKNNGEYLNKFLCKDFNIYPEMWVKDYVLLMTSFADSLEDYNRLLEAINAFKPQACTAIKDKWVYPKKMPKIILTPMEGAKRQHITVKLEDATGKTSAGFIIPYPPGIPIIAPGEEFSQDIIGYLINCPFAVKGIIKDKNNCLYVKVIV